MRIVTIGEGMVEIAGGIGAQGRIGFGGDVLNVSIGLARFGHAPAILTALGTDGWSDALVSLWGGEGVDTAMIARHPDRLPGIYGIRLDEAGERSFSYWRDRSAARDLFALPGIDALLERAAGADLLFLSGITLSLYDDPRRARIAAVADAVRARGGTVAFDGNYRPGGWAAAAVARRAFEAFAERTTIALPTAEDEAMLHGTETPEAVAARWRAAGAREVIVKLGARGVLVSAGGADAHVATTRRDPVDTSGAGDAFDAGYLAARIAGISPVEAARLGNALAGEAVMHPGAIAPRDAFRDAVATLRARSPAPPPGAGC